MSCHNDMHLNGDWHYGDCGGFAFRSLFQFHLLSTDEKGKESLSTPLHWINEERWKEQSIMSSNFNTTCAATVRNKKLLKDRNLTKGGRRPSYFFVITKGRDIKRTTQAYVQMVHCLKSHLQSTVKHMILKTKLQSQP